MVALHKMQIIQRGVRGSEAEKDNLLPKFFVLRLWSGCSSLFFTLNPHDLRSPLTILLLQQDAHLRKSSPWIGTTPIQKLTLLHI
jgi:hypothetical protein